MHPFAVSICKSNRVGGVRSPVARHAFFHISRGLVAIVAIHRPRASRKTTGGAGRLQALKDGPAVALFPALVLSQMTVTSSPVRKRFRDKGPGSTHGSSGAHVWLQYCRSCGRSHFRRNCVQHLHAHRQMSSSVRPDARKLQERLTTSHLKTLHPLHPSLLSTCILHFAPEFAARPIPWVPKELHVLILPHHFTARSTSACDGAGFFAGVRATLAIFPVVGLTSDMETE